MRILVTGGAGYIGSHTVRALIESGADVLVLDNLSTGHREALHPQCAFFHGDIQAHNDLADIFKAQKIDGVIHFAASSLVGESMTNPLKYYYNNIGGTRSLLEAMVEYDVKNLVFSSTAAVYGEPKQVPIMESDSTIPTNTYGETKLAIERMLHWTCTAHGTAYVALRYFNACGAHESGMIGEAHAPETHLIPLALQTALGLRDRLQIFGDTYPTKDGTCVRDYIHVCDLAQAHILAMEYLLRGGESCSLNLGNGTGFTVKEILRAAELAADRRIPVSIGPPRAGDPIQLIASSEKARIQLGWQPKYTDINTIVATAWKWHSAHPRGYTAVPADA